MDDFSRHSDPSIALAAPFVHPTADVEPAVSIGPGTKVWHQVHVRTGASIGSDCVLGKGVFVDVGVAIGDRCKLQNGASILHGYTVEDGVFIGPGALLLNDRNPRATTPGGHLKTDADWHVLRGAVHVGAAIGAGAVILPGLSIGAWSMVGAGSVVTRNVPDHGLVVGNPGRLVGFVCRCGARLPEVERTGSPVASTCTACGASVTLVDEALGLLLPR